MKSKKDPYKDARKKLNEALEASCAVKMPLSDYIEFLAESMETIEAYIEAAREDLRRTKGDPVP